MRHGASGVGPKRALQLARELGIASVSDLDQAVRGGRLRRMAGFGPKGEERIARGIAVAAGDTTLRDALRALPPGATEDDIGAVLAAHVMITATGAERGGERDEPRGQPGPCSPVRLARHIRGPCRRRL